MVDKSWKHIFQAQERKQRFSQHHEWCSKEVVFSADFNNQHISVSNALIRHDRQTAKEEVEAEKKEMTHSVKVKYQFKFFYFESELAVSFQSTEYFLFVFFLSYIDGYTQSF